MFLRFEGCKSLVRNCSTSYFENLIFDIGQNAKLDYYKSLSPNTILLLLRLWQVSSFCVKTLSC